MNAKAIRHVLTSPVERSARQGGQAPDNHSPDGLYRVLVESIKDHAIFRLDPAGNVVTWNTGAERIHGYQANEIIGQHVSRLHVAEDLASGNPQRILQLALSQGSCEEEGLRLCKDGSRFLANVTTTPLYDFPHTHAGFAVVLRDVTECRRAREQAETSEATLRSVLETAPDFILTVDRAGKILFINRTLPHHSPAQVVGTNAFDYVPPEFHERAKAACEYVFRTAQKTEYETLGPANVDGTRGWYLTRVGPILHDREVVAVTMCATDVTQRKQTEEQLRQSQKMQAIGQLASGVAHDFNNLLTVISGYSEFLLTRVPADNPLRLAVATIHEAGEQAADLTRQLLAFSRRTALEPRVVDLNVVVGATEKLLRRLIGEQIVLTVVLDSAARRVKVDPSQLNQVLLNLAVNARDAMPHGGKLTIETSSVEPSGNGVPTRADVRPGPRVLLTVSDTGAGMTPEVQAHLFEPFFTTKEPGKGTGLGLATVFGIVKANGGDVEVASKPDAGTTFRIYFPAVEDG